MSNWRPGCETILVLHIEHVMACLIGVRDVALGAVEGEFEPERLGHQQINITVRPLLGGQLLHVHKNRLRQR